MKENCFIYYCLKIIYNMYLAIYINFETRKVFKKIEKLYWHGFIVSYLVTSLKSCSEEKHKEDTAFYISTHSCWRITLHNYELSA